MDQCKHTRTLSISAKCSDCCVVTYGDVESVGYVPRDLGIGGGDYVEFNLCLNCGKIPEFTTLADESVIKLLKGEEYE